MSCDAWSVTSIATIYQLRAELFLLQRAQVLSVLEIVLTVGQLIEQGWFVHDLVQIALQAEFISILLQ